VSGDRAPDSSRPDDPRPAPDLTEGWYLMSTRDLERELARRRGEGGGPSHALRLTIAEALAYRDAGNLPDEYGRTLRLLLVAKDRDEVQELPLKRALYEPDYHDAPTWRRPGSKPVNVVPLRGDVAPSSGAPWWEEPQIAALEAEWHGTGAIQGLQIPEAYRGFIYKTILSLRAEGLPVTAASVAGSLARWLLPGEAAEIRRALEDANKPTDVAEA
jgi:hypothetical protein